MPFFPSVYALQCLAILYALLGSLYAVDTLSLLSFIYDAVLYTLRNAWLFYTLC